MSAKPNHAMPTANTPPQASQAAPGPNAFLDAMNAAAQMPTVDVGIAAAVSLLGAAIMPKGAGRARLNQIGTGMLASFLGRVASSPPALHQHPATPPVPAQLVKAGVDRWLTTPHVSPTAKAPSSWIVLANPPGDK